jgi:hypothetical protein
MTTYELTDRLHFASFVRAARRTGLFSSYGRLGAFGRSLIRTDGVRLTLPNYTFTPPLNIHRKGV